MNPLTLDQRLQHQIERLERSETGQQLGANLQELREKNWVTIGYFSPEQAEDYKQLSGVTDTTFRNQMNVNGPEPVYTSVALNPYGSDNALFLTLVHEARHCWQDWKDPYPYGKTPESYVMRGFAQEADATAHECRVAYELAQSGDSGPWEHFRDDPQRKDIAHVFVEALPQGMSAAMEAAHYQWERSSDRCEDYRTQFVTEAHYAQTGQARMLLHTEAVDIKTELDTNLALRLQSLEMPRIQEPMLEPERTRRPSLDRGIGF